MTNHLGRMSFFSTPDRKQWAVVRKATVPAFSFANIRWDAAPGLRQSAACAGCQPCICAHVLSQAPSRPI